MPIPITEYGRKDLVIATVACAALTAACAWFAADQEWVAWLAIVPVAVWLLLVNFFRDPERTAPVGERLIISPADGKVTDLEEVDEPEFLGGRAVRLGIFLSPLDVHVNRTPVSGRVLEVDYRPGRFLPAYRHDAATENERTEIRIDHQGRTVVCRQVVGLLARRVVCRLVPGMDVAPGQRLGIMKFGSRMDVFLPTDAHVEVAVGEMVRGGETIMARLTSTNDVTSGAQDTR
jgi:phosphatidylserine decarboxylase